MDAQVELFPHTHAWERKFLCTIKNGRWMFPCDTPYRPAAQPAGRTAEESSMDR